MGVAVALLVIVNRHVARDEARLIANFLVRTLDATPSAQSPFAEAVTTPEGERAP